MSQETLNDVTSSRLKSKLEIAEKEAPLAIQMMLDDAKEGKDFMLKLGAGFTSEFIGNGNVKLLTPVGSYGLHSNAINQLSAKYGISGRDTKKYINGEFEGGSEWQHKLLAFQLNQHALHSKQQRFLIRSVRDEIRACLSDQYKILDSDIIVTEFLKVAIAAGAIYAGGHNSGLNVWLEVMSPNLVEFETENNGVLKVAFGSRIKTSDYGCGALELRSFIMQAVCANGMVAEQQLNQKHLGEKLPDGFDFSKQTVRVHTQRMQLVVRDMTKHLFGSNYVRSKIEQIQAASKVKIDMKKELGKMFDTGVLRKNEVTETEVVFLNNKIEDGVMGEGTLWKLAQGLTAIARDKEPERQRELAEIAGQLLPTGRK